MWGMMCSLFLCLFVCFYVCLFVCTFVCLFASLYPQALLSKHEVIFGGHTGEPEDKARSRSGYFKLWSGFVVSLQFTSCRVEWSSNPYLLMLSKHLLSLIQNQCVRISFTLPSVYSSVSLCASIHSGLHAQSLLSYMLIRYVDWIQ